MVRTYSQVDWKAADAAWRDGEFSDEWAPIRELARKRGILFPPAGTQWDSWEDDPPSQRAILIRAIRDAPETLRGCIERASSWSEVVELLIAFLGERRAGVSQAERDLIAEDPTRRQAPELLRDILRDRDACRMRAAQQRDHVATFAEPVVEEVPPWA